MGPAIGRPEAKEMPGEGRKEAYGNPGAKGTWHSQTEDGASTSGKGHSDCLTESRISVQSLPSIRQLTAKNCHRRELKAHESSPVVGQLAIGTHTQHTTHNTRAYTRTRTHACAHAHTAADIQRIIAVASHLNEVVWHMGSE